MNFPLTKARLPRIWLKIFAFTALPALSISPSRAFTLLNANQLVFKNVDHAPVGAGSTFTYGYKGDKCGLGQTSSKIPFNNGGGGVVIGVKSGGTLKVMPFVATAGNVSSSASFYADANVTRALGPCTDAWNVESGALTWTHYTPAWKMPDLATATLAEKKRFFLPATWMQFTVNNTTGSAQEFYFGLPANASPRTFAGGAYQGVTTGEASFAVKAGTCDILTGNALTSALNGMNTGFAFRMTVPGGQSKTLTVVVAHYRTAVVDTRITGTFYYRTLFGSVDSVVDEAMAILPDARTRSQQLATAMQNASLGAFRQFMASDSLHSFQANTFCLTDPSGKVYWREFEGDYEFVNTFDLTVDHAFYDTVMHPWVLRNVLDAFSGLSNGGLGYTFDHPLYNPNTHAQVSPTGFSFHHDMGTGLTTNAPNVDPTGYELSFSYMGQEQVQNWILCAGLYWKRTNDHSWLGSNAATLQALLNTMLLRDDVNAGSRDGITSFINLMNGTTEEITTYDGLDASLKQPHLSGRTTVRSWACYVALQSMFTQLGDTTRATTAGNMAVVCAATIVSKWNTYSPSLGHIPAFLDGSNTAATIPMIEGLSYPLEMGLSSAISLSGPYATMLQNLKSHMTNILVSGKCLDSTSGAWQLTTGSNNTWQSKVYSCQYGAEKVLGMTGNTIKGTVDQIHATFQMQQAPYQSWSDQLNSAGNGLASQSLHYPRGITSVLWWLTPATNPNFPSPGSAPAAPTGVTARAGNGQVILNWDSAGQTTTFSVSRSTSSGGTYATIASGLAGASYIDHMVTSGGTLYYKVTGTNSAGTGAASSAVSVAAAPGSLPASWTAADIGSPGVAGSQSYSNVSNSFGILASGSDIYDSSDSFRFVSRSASGNCTIIARVASLGSSENWSKAGLMIRESGSANSINAAIVVTPANGVSFQWRSSTGGSTSFLPNPSTPGITAPHWIRLVRSGNTFTGSRSSDGVTWTTVGSATIPMAANTSIGLCATSHNNSALNPAVVDSVTTSVMPASWSGQDIGSPGVAGSAFYAPDNSFTVNASGNDIYDSNDSFHFVSRSASGNCAIIARVASLGSAHPWSKAGVMIRESSAQNSANAAIVVSAANGISFQYRTSTGGGTANVNSPSGLSAPYYVSLTRSGNTFTGAYSPDGVTWTTLGSASLSMAASTSIGLASVSHENSILNQAIFDNVFTSVMPSGWTTADIGSLPLLGSSYHAPDESFLLTGSGEIYDSNDNFHYTYRSVSGNCTIQALVEDQVNTHPWAKAGVMIRESTAPGSAAAAVVLTPSNGVSFQWRATTSANTDYTTGVADMIAPYWVKLMRNGSTFIASRSPDGVNWTTVGSATVTMETNVLIGLPVTSHDNSQLSSSAISHITITTP